MVLKCVQFLLQSVANFTQLFVVAMDSFQFSAKADHFSTQLCVLLLGKENRLVQFLGSATFNFLLSNQLSLSLKQKIVPLVCTLAILLHAT